MRSNPPAVRCWLLTLALFFAALPAQPQENDPAYDAAVFLLSQTMQPYRDGRHNNLLLSLRHLNDPELAPLFEMLIASPYASQRVHGHLGQAEISPTGQLDLAAVAEIEDEAEVTGLLGAAIDSDVISNDDLVQVLAWEGITPASRQALAVRVVANGGAVEDSMLFASLIQGDDEHNTTQVLRHGLAALLLMQKGDTSARAELDKLSRLGPENARDAILAQILEVALRHEFESIGPWALALAQDNEADQRLRFIALRGALRFPGQSGQSPAAAQWQSFFTQTDDAAQRIRLALIALEAAPHTLPELFSPLISEDDTLLNRIGVAGRAIASDAPDAGQAILRLVEHGHPMSLVWALRHARDHSGEQRITILLAIIDSFAQAPPRQRGRRASTAIDAVHTLAELETDTAIDALPALLNSPATNTPRGELTLSHVVFLGMVHANAEGLEELASSFPIPRNPDARDLHLLLQARWDCPLEEAQWERIVLIVSGHSLLDDSLRIQLAWLYLKHVGRSDDALRDAAAQTR